jgi:hypothetical protein
LPHIASRKSFLEGARRRLVGPGVSMDDVSPALLIDCIWGYKRTAALQAAIRLDVFSHIATGATDAVKLAGVCGAAERGIRILAITWPCSA